MPIGKNSNEPTGSAMRIWTVSIAGQERGSYSIRESENNYCYYLALINCSSSPLGLSTQFSEYH